jgi:transcriptional regulator with XRE-family HTH domain
MQAHFLHTPYDGLMATRVHHLKALRETAGLSIRELGRQIGQDRSNMRYWERTGNLPRSNLLIRSLSPDLRFTWKRGWLPV